MSWMRAWMIIFVAMLPMGLSGCLSGNSSNSHEPALSEQAAGVLMIGFRGQTLAEADVILEDIEQRRIAGVILFDRDVELGTTRNIENQQQLTELVGGLQQASGNRLLVAIDQEGGAVNRLKTTYGFPETHSARHFGDLNDLDATRAEADQTANLLKELGINVNFAPVVDLDIDPDSPAIGRWGRSYSADPNIVVDHAHEVIAAHHAQGVANAIKHFPGHGSAGDDSHEGFTDVTHTWQEQELEPYRQLLRMTPSPAMVMTAHIFHETLDPAHPATLSRNVIHGMLRDELGFDGLIVSDDMQMGAITDHYGLEEALERSLNAGVDLLIFANNLAYQPDIAQEAQAIIVRLVQQGRVPATRLREAWQRVCDLKTELHLAC